MSDFDPSPLAPFPAGPPAIVISIARRVLACGLAPLFFACAHARTDLVATMPALGPRVLVLVPDPPLVASGAGDALCLSLPLGFSLDAAGRLSSPPDAPVTIEAALAGGGARVPLTVRAARRIDGAPHLCFAPAEPIAPGRTFTRITVRASELLLVPEVRWVRGRP